MGRRATCKIALLNPGDPRLAKTNVWILKGVGGPVAAPIGCSLVPPRGVGALERNGSESVQSLLLLQSLLLRQPFQTLLLQVRLPHCDWASGDAVRSPTELPLQAGMMIALSAEQ